MALGEILRKARLSKGLSEKDVANATNMMVQVVRELEQEDFHRIAAPIYGKGFIRLYAELLDLDSAPLVEDFMILYSNKESPSLKTFGKSNTDSPGNTGKKSVTASPALDMEPVPGISSSSPLPSSSPVEASFEAPAGEIPMRQDIPEREIISRHLPDESPELPVEESEGSPGEVQSTAPVPVSNTPDEPDLFNYASAPREEKIRPSLQIGGGREKRKERKEKGNIPRQPSTPLKDGIISLKRVLSLAGSVVVLLRALRRRMPLRDLLVVGVVIALLIMIVMIVGQCVGSKNAPDSPEKIRELRERCIKPPLPYCE